MRHMLKMSSQTSFVNLKTTFKFKTNRYQKYSIKWFDDELMCTLCNCFTVKLFRIHFVSDNVLKRYKKIFIKNLKEEKVLQYLSEETRMRSVWTGLISNFSKIRKQNHSVLCRTAFKENNYLLSMNSFGDLTANIFRNDDTRFKQLWGRQCTETKCE